MNCLLTFFAIIGTIIGSGFISGKEVAVFFTRFGYWSFPCIVLTGVLFYFLFKLLLNKGGEAVKNLEKSKVCLIFNLLLCTIFSASMFAGTLDMIKGFGATLAVIFVICLLFTCARVSKRGISSLNKLNLLLVPVMTVVLIVALGIKLSKGCPTQNIPVKFVGLSIIYTILYVVLNTANGCVLIANLGQKLSSKQKTRVAFLSALVLCLILTIINIVLLSCPSVLTEEMPLLQLFSGRFRQVLSFAIMIGCLTTLFSLVYSCSSSIRGLCKNEYLIFCLSVVLPFVVSLLGFGFIVSYLYPVGSVFAIFLMSELSFKPFFKRTYKKIHSHRKQTK